MTMTYLGQGRQRSGLGPAQDELKVLQQVNGGENICVFKGPVTPGGRQHGDLHSVWCFALLDPLSMVQFYTGSQPLYLNRWYPWKIYSMFYASFKVPAWNQTLSHLIGFRADSSPLPLQRASGTRRKISGAQDSTFYHCLPLTMLIWVTLGPGETPLKT